MFTLHYVKNYCVFFYLVTTSLKLQVILSSFDASQLFEKVRDVYVYTLSQIGTCHFPYLLQECLIILVYFPTEMI